MTLNELKKAARRIMSEWCDQLPDDGDFSEPETIIDMWPGEGTPQNGDYAVIFIFHNSNEQEGGDHADAR